MRSLKEFYSHPTRETLEQYLKPTVPQLTTANLEVPLLEGSERTQLRVPFNGDASLVVVYRSKGKIQTGAVSSMSRDETDISLVQLQGGRGGYRVNNGLRWVDLIADRWQLIAEHPDSGIERITMPLSREIEGWSDATTEAHTRYSRFSQRLGMRLSTEEQMYIKDIAK